MKERTKEKLIDVAVGIWVMIIPMVELHFLEVPTRSWAVAFLYVPLAFFLILIHWSLAWFAAWIYEKFSK